jgi:hypothetical protein
MGVSGFNPGKDESMKDLEVTSCLSESQHSIQDPLWQFGRDDMTRLCRVHEEEVGIMYPVIDIQSVIEHARIIGTLMGHHRLDEVRALLIDEKTLQLKMVMCCALAVEEHGYSERASKLYESMESILNRKLMADQVSVSNLPVLALLAGYRFLSSDEILAWRVMGQVTRLCLELGIHRCSGIVKIDDDSERRNALNSFWSAYVLDRRWAFGTGLPYVVQDAEIDPDLPLPVGGRALIFSDRRCFSYAPNNRPSTLSTNNPALTNSFF